MASKDLKGEAHNRENLGLSAVASSLWCMQQRGTGTQAIVVGGSLVKLVAPMLSILPRVGGARHRVAEWSHQSGVIVT